MIQVFKSIPVVRDIWQADALPADLRALPRDTITLGWEDRLKARGRRRTDGGVEFGTALDRGTFLREGDCLVLDQPPLIVTVIEALEDVFVIEPRSPADWARIAYQIGNSHQPLMLTDTAIVCPDVLGMEQVLAHYEIPFVRAHRAFTPLTNAGDLAPHRHQP